MRSVSFRHKSSRLALLLLLLLFMSHVSCTLSLDESWGAGVVHQVIVHMEIYSTSRQGDIIMLWDLCEAFGFGDIYSSMCHGQCFGPSLSRSVKFVLSRHGLVVWSFWHNKLPIWSSSVRTSGKVIRVSVSNTLELLTLSWFCPFTSPDHDFLTVFRNPFNHHIYFLPEDFLRHCPAYENACFASGNSRSSNQCYPTYECQPLFRVNWRNCRRWLCVPVDLTHHFATIYQEMASTAKAGTRWKMFEWCLSLVSLLAINSWCLSSTQPDQTLRWEHFRIRRPRMWYN